MGEEADVFTIRGLIDGREVAVTWHEPGARRVRGIGGERGLDGDRDLVMRAVIDEVERRTFKATTSGPHLAADLDDARSALVQLTSYFDEHHSAKFISRAEPWPHNGLYFARLVRIEGDPPVLDYPIPPGAVA